MQPDTTALTEAHCLGCVFYPPNLPRDAYAEADWAMLEALSCALEHSPGDADCLGSRKTSCSLVDLPPSPRHAAQA